MTPGRFESFNLHCATSVVTMFLLCTARPGPTTIQPAHVSCYVYIVISILNSSTNNPKLNETHDSITTIRSRFCLFEVKYLHSTIANFPIIYLHTSLVHSRPICIKLFSNISKKRRINFAWCSIVIFHHVFFAQIYENHHSQFFEIFVSQ